MVMDEVLLLVNAFFKLKSVESPILQVEIIEKLSENMRNLPFFPTLREETAFRSYAGMKMCLANIGRFDLDKISIVGKLEHGSDMQKRVYAYYLDKQDLLEKIAAAICSLKDIDFPLLEEYNHSIIGKLLPSYHAYLESNTNLRVRLLDKISPQAYTVCMMCGKDLGKDYGEFASKMMEAHIAIPLEEHQRNIRVSLSNTRLLCPSCHKYCHIINAEYPSKF